MARRRDSNFRPTGKCRVPGPTGREKTQRSLCRQSRQQTLRSPQCGGPRRLSSVLGRQRAPGQEGRQALSPRAALRSLCWPPLSRERAGDPRGQSRRGAPGRAGQADCSRAGGGARRVLGPRSPGCSLWKKSNPQVLAPSNCSPNPCGVHGGNGHHRLCLPSLLPLLPAPLPAPAKVRSKPRKRARGASNLRG